LPERAIRSFSALATASPSSPIRPSGFSSRIVADTGLWRNALIASPGARAEQRVPALPPMPLGAQPAQMACTSAGLPRAALPLSLAGLSLARHLISRALSSSGIEAALSPIAALAVLAFATPRLRAPPHCSPFTPDVVVPPG
jgi:hypothetical protein